MKIRVVRLTSYLGEIERVVVREIGTSVCVCRMEEFIAAAQQGRDPITVAFGKHAVLGEREIEVSGEEGGGASTPAPRARGE